MIVNNLVVQNWIDDRIIVTFNDLVSYTPLSLQVLLDDNNIEVTVPVRGDVESSQVVRLLEEIE